jgi:hypothetical protein
VFSGKLYARKRARTVWEGGNGEGLESTSPVPYFIWEGADGNVLKSNAPAAYFTLLGNLSSLSRNEGAIKHSECFYRQQKIGSISTII